MDDDNEDRLTSLPDSLIHEIFKFMDTKQVIATSLLSKRWNSLCRFNPYLNFTYEEKPVDKAIDFNRFENFVDQVLLSRDHDLQAFCVEKCYQASPEKLMPSLEKWVHHAITRNVQQVKLESVDIYAPTLQLLCANLKCLTLDEVNIFFKVDQRELLLNFPIMDLLLNCPIMETLVLHECSFGGGLYGYWNIKLSAPILNVLKIEGGLYRNYTIDNLSSIVTAEVHVSIWLDEDHDREDFFDNILRGLTNAKSLTLSLDNLLACSKVPVTLNAVATFQSLRHLKLATGYRESSFCFSTSLKLLGKCPLVETLVLDGFLSWNHEIMEEDLVAELQSWCRHCHLKTLEIKTWQIAITDCAFKFIECIIRNAASLKNVVLTTLDTSVEQEKLVDICLKLKVKPKVTKVSSRGIQVSLKPSTQMQWESV